MKTIAEHEADKLRAVWNERERQRKINLSLGIFETVMGVVGSAWAFSQGIVVVGNLLLCLFGVGLWGWLRSRKP